MNVNQIIEKIALKLNGVKYCVVHAGDSHRDESIFTGFVLLANPSMKVYRRNPTKEEMLDKDIVVADQGKVHSPELKKYDHHMDEFKGKNECALSLFLKDCGVWDAIGWYKPLQFMVSVDNRGIFSVAKELEINAKNFLKYCMLSPLESYTQHEFEKFTGDQFVSGECAYLLQLSARQMLETIVKIGESIKKFDDNTEIVKSGNLVGIFNKLTGNEATLGFQQWRDDREINAQFSIVLDERNGNWKILRLDDYPKLNFTQFDENKVQKLHPKMAWSHPNGFICGTIAGATIQDCLDVVEFFTIK